MTQPRDISLTVESLSLSRGDTPLIAGLSLSVEPGQALWLTGPNGIGKTTLLLAMAGLLMPDRGTVAWSQSSQILPARNAVAYAAHQGPEQAGLLLREDLAFWQALHGDKTPTETRLEAVGLSGRGRTPVAGLSAGQRRRLSLARLVSSNRSAWLMDEPLAGLDASGRSLVTQTLGTHLASGGIAVIASHGPVPIADVEARKLVLEPGA
jgi:heme exporter protein A